MTEERHDYPQVEFEEIDREVIARVTMKSGVVIEFAAVCQSSSLASALAESLCEEIGSAAEKVKAAAYEKGWSDFRERRKKKRKFCRDLDPDPKTM